MVSPILNTMIFKRMFFRNIPNTVKYLKSAFALTFLTTFLSQSIDAQTTLEFETDVEDLTSSLISTELPDVTITFTMSSGTLFNVDGNGLGGSTNKVIFGSGVPGSFLTVSFSTAVDIVDLLHIDPASLEDTLTFTPTGGSNSVVTSYHPENGGATATLNWTGVNSFVITAASGNGQYAIDKLRLLIESSNTAPTASTNTGSALSEGGTDIVSSSEFDFDDAEESDTDITYTLDDLPDNGTLRKNTVALTLGSTFNQDDINNNRIDYVHNGGETTSDSFRVDVSDGQGGILDDQTFNFTISAVNDDPTVTSLPTDITVTEDTESNVDLSVSDFGDVDSGTITVTLTVSAGTWSSPADGSGIGGGVTETLVSSTVITLVGAVADINTYLNTATNLRYTGASNINGGDAATIIVEVNDGDGSGDVNLGTVNIDITAVNDTPSFTIGLNQTVSQSAGVQTISDHTSGMSDNDGDTQTLTFNVSNDNNGIFDIQPDINEATGDLTFTLRLQPMAKLLLR